MDSKKLSVLMTALDLGSFSRASDVVGYTQSGLTHLVDALEKEIGVSLVKRSHSGITLTEDGKKLLPAIRDFLRADTALEEQIKSLRRTATETIRIAAYSSIAMHWMPEILYRFRRECPDVTVELRMVDHALEPFELLENRQTDVIFASRQHYDFCEWTPLYRERMYAILPNNYPAKTKELFPIEEFTGLDFLMPYGRFDIDVNAAFRERGVTVHEITSHVDDETVIRMVGKGLGVSMMTELMIRGRVDDVLCLPVSPSITRELGMGLLSGIPRPDSINKLKDCVLAYMKERTANKA